MIKINIEEIKEIKETLLNLKTIIRISLTKKNTKHSATVL